jgi:hypothetical protein
MHESELRAGGIYNLAERVKALEVRVDELTELYDLMHKAREGAY